MPDLTQSERMCIQRAFEARQQAIGQQLRELRVSPNLAEFGSLGYDTYSPTAAGKLLQLVFLPLVVLLQAIFIPLLYAYEVRGFYRAKKQLAFRLRELEMAYGAPGPTEKTLESLWQAHGLCEREFSEEDRIALISKWLDILYGTGAADQTQLCLRLSKIYRTRAEANFNLQGGENTSWHFNCVDAVTTLVKDISNELPPYAEAITSAVRSHPCASSTNAMGKNEGICNPHA